MTPPTLEIVRHRVAIAGRIADALSGRLLAGARVEITGAPAAFLNLVALRAIAAGTAGSLWAAMAERPDRTRTARDGHFHFLDLPAGAYTLTASLPDAGSRYGTATLPLTLVADSLGNVVRAQADMTLPPTAVKGKVSGPASAAVPMAELAVGGSGERTWTDAQGGYLLSAIEAGSRVVLATARGFNTNSQPVTLAQAGAVVTLDWTLTPSP
ncbi:MAG TPA: carboxypeptidase-like regulatory domain-containing protein [Thermoanaerobaculia bacterium]|nr:carboxypeptidase-like regulatory domain-containing protein [Thermoanaerobaculia bacterium]